jgi:hypothetical protein
MKTLDDRDAVFRQGPSNLASGQPGSVVLYEQLVARRSEACCKHAVDGMYAGDTLKILLYQRTRELNRHLHLCHRKSE